MASSGTKRSHSEMADLSSAGSLAAHGHIADIQTHQTSAAEPPAKRIITANVPVSCDETALQYSPASHNGNVATAATHLAPTVTTPQRSWADYLDALDDQTARAILAYALSESQTAQAMVYSAGAAALTANEERRLRELRRVFNFSHFSGSAWYVLNKKYKGSGSKEYD